jgi:hypothetical protein
MSPSERMRVRKEQAPQNLSWLRKIALNLPRGGPVQLEPTGKLSKAKKRKMAGWDDEYRVIARKAKLAIFAGWM